MFKLTTHHSYSWPVIVQTPVDGGKFTKATFDATFKVIPQERIDAIVRGGNVDAELLCEVTQGWKGVQDDDGQDLPFSEEARDRLLSVPYVRAGLVDAYLDSLSGGARRKN
ncbi:MAG: hypothetical protein HQL34_05540 [Alphaproteobacteria bacterium]|nr:hypothetical protein [Alphaproteobacteria bacterium]